MNNLSKIKYLYKIFLIWSISMLSCNASEITGEQLYGAWANIGTSDLGISGVIFITPKYAAYLEKSKKPEGYTFKKYLYSLSKHNELLEIYGIGWFRVEKSKNGEIILNRTKWIIPYVLSYDGIIKRAKMSDKALSSFLDQFKLDVDIMKKTSIKNLKKNNFSKEDIENLREKVHHNLDTTLSEIKIKTRNKDIEDNSLPPVIEEYLKQKKD